MTTTTTPPTPVPHTPWCTDHQYGGKWPQDGFCKGDEEYVAGKWETYLTGDYGNPAGDRIFVCGGDDGSPAQVEQLRARLADLLRQQAGAPETGHASRLSIEGFLRKGPDGRLTSLDTIHDPGRLMGQLRSDHRICGALDADPVVILRARAAMSRETSRAPSRSRLTTTTAW